MASWRVGGTRRRFFDSLSSLRMTAWMETGMATVVSGLLELKADGCQLGAVLNV